MIARLQAMVRRWQIGAEGARSPRALFKFSAFLGLAALAACSGADSSRELPEIDGLVERDSAGVRIVEAPAHVLESVLPWVVSEAPDLELGRTGDDSPYQFHRIAGIVGLSDGGLVVVDGGSLELRWFSASGEHVSTMGGPGQGPGEFTNPLLVRQFRPDSLLIYDLALMRFTWAAIDGSGGRTLGAGRGAFTGTPQVAIGSRALFRSAAGLDQCQENESCELPLSLHWVDLDGTPVDTLMVLNRRMLRYRESQRLPLFLDGPLDQTGLAAVGPEGAVLEGGPQFELRQFDFANRLIAIYRVAGRNMDSPADALTRYVQRYSDPNEMARIYGFMSMPDVLPPFQTLRVDHLGWYWAELFRPGQNDPSKWLVYDPEGRARGVVELPSELEVHDIGVDWILGRRIAEDGVETVSRHRLDRVGR